MNSSVVIEEAQNFSKNKLSGEGTGHDWWHVVRVVNIARKIHSVEGGNWSVIELALLLHDVGDRKVINENNDDYSIAENFLIDQGLTKAMIDKVMHIIKTMSYSKSFDSMEKYDSIEFKIVQDADRLDAIGAIGIARAFAFGGSRARMLYDPDHKAQKFTSSEEYKNAGGSTIHHFYEKLLLLRDKLNTDTAKEIATQRDEFMRLFLDEFFEEWEAKK